MQTRTGSRPVRTGTMTRLIRHVHSPDRRRRPARARRIVLAVTCLVALLALMSTAAGAAQTRNLLRTFGCSTTAENCGVPAPAGATLSNPQGEAVDQSSGDVYVADTANNRIEKFGPDGEFILTFGRDVNKTKVAGGVATQAEQDLCTAVEVGLGSECQKGESGSAPGELKTAEFLAVDQSTHDVYVADTADNLVSKFSSSGVLETAWGNNGTGGAANGQLNGSTTATFGEIAGIAVNTAGELDVLNMGGEVFEFDAGGVFKTGVPTERETKPYGLGVDAAGNLLKAIGAETVAKFSPSGAEIGEVTGEIHPRALAFVPAAGGESSGDLYAATEGRTLEHYAFDGTGGLIASDSTAVGFIASGVTVAASGDTFLSNGEEGEVYQFGPLVTDPAVLTGPPGKVAPHTAILKGTVNPEGQPLTGCAFEYIEASKYKPHAVDPYTGGGTVSCVEGFGDNPGEIGEGTNPVPVQAEATGLSPDTGYDYRLTAANHEGQSQGANVEFRTAPPPPVDSATVSSLTATAAVLNAKINPENSVTHYHFEYVTQAEFEASGFAHATRVPACEAGVLGVSGCEAKDPSIPPGEGDVLVSAPVSGLEAHEHAYDWRVVATNESGTTTTLPHTFSYQTTAAGLPDSRAYEMVTPNRKNGAVIGGVSNLGIPADIAADGQRLIASAIQCFAGAQSCNAKQNDGIGSPYEFTRTSAGWITTPLSPPATGISQGQSQIFAYSAQAGTALFGIPTGPPLGEGEDDLYVREAETATQPARFAGLGPDTPPEDGAQEPSGGVLAASEQAHTADLSHFARDAHYDWSSPFVEESNIHEVFEVAPGTAGKNRPLDVGVSGGYENRNLISTCGTSLGQAHANGAAPGGTISADGRTVYFTVLPNLGSGCRPGGNGPAPVEEVFARVDGETPGAHTVAISEPSEREVEGREELVPAAPYAGCESGPCERDVNEQESWRGAEFIAGSEDGSDALFASTQQLTDGASQDPNPADNAAIDSASSHGCVGTTGANGCNLYLLAGVTAVHSSERRLLDVSAGEGGAVVPKGPRVQGVLAVSPDASHVYFVAKGVLTAAERPGCSAEWAAAGRASEAACHAEEGQDNVYVYDSETSHTSFITIMPAADSSQWHEEEAGKPANVTPDGRVLVFPSRGELTPDDTSRSGANQVFRYDAGSSGAGSLTRISIGNAGFNDAGNRLPVTPCNVKQGICSEDASIVPAAEASRRDPSMSDNGSRVFFKSPVGLTAHALDDVQVTDTNELFHETEENIPLYAENVYEWESEGAGSCRRASGCVFLISDGRDLSVAGIPAAGCSQGSAVCLLGSDTSGDNVFFATTGQLVSSDTNTELDYYDARVCEPGATPANPCIESPPPPSACSGEECHGIPAGVPGVPAAPSATFNGAGNATPSPAQPPKPKTAEQLRIEKLNRALKACHKNRSKHNRTLCEKRAHKKYAKKTSAKKATSERRTK